MHLCQSCHNLAIGAEDRVQTFFHSNDPGDHGNFVKVPYSYSAPSYVSVPFGQNLVSGSEDRAQTRFSP